MSLLFKLDTPWFIEIFHAWFVDGARIIPKPGSTGRAHINPLGIPRSAASSV